MPKGRRRKIEVPTDTQPQFESGDTAEDIERRRREIEERDRREMEERERREMEERERRQKYQGKQRRQRTEIQIQNACNPDRRNYR